MSENATIHSYTVIRVAPPSHQERVPYCVAVLADAADGSLFTAFVNGYTDGQQVEIGQPVQRSTVDDELPHYHF